MNTRVFIALSCLLAAAHAWPAAVPSSSCSLGCSGRNFWTGYKTGTTLQYAFEQKVEISSGLNQQKSLLMQVAGRANVEVHGDCEMVLTVDVQSTKTSKSPSEASTLDSKSLPKALVDALKAPLRFSFEDGRVQGLCPGDSENRASLNFKRGLLSQLHLSIDKPEQEVRVREVDVLGNCYTIYTKLGANKFEKTKDLSSCSTNFEVYPRFGVKFEAPESSTQWPTVVQGNLKCTVELDAESQIIKENQCEESHVLGNNLGESSLGERVKVTTSLKLQQKTLGVASALFDVKGRDGLSHKHKSGEKCHDSKAWFEEDIFHTGNECLEKKLPVSGTASSDFKALAKKTIEELCEETKSNNMQNSSAAKYGDLIKYLRGVTNQEDFNSLFEWVKNGYCASNTMLKVIVYSAIPSVGTRQSTQIIINQLKGSDSMTTDKFIATWLVNGIALLPHPTPEIIRDVLDFTKKAKEDSLMIISKEQPLALSAVTGRYCSSVNSNCETNEAVVEVLTFFSDALGTNCSKLESQDDSSSFDYAFAALLSIGNIGRATGGASAIIGCAENKKLSLANRVFALRSLRRFPELSTAEKLRLGQLIQSRDLDSELRITAYQVVARLANASFWSDERVIKKLSDLLQDETDDQQVQRYIYLHLTQWIKKQRRSTDSFTISNILREYAKVIAASGLSGMQASGYWRKQIKIPSMKSKIDVESNLIYSSNSIMPRFANLNLTVESPISGEAINLFEFGLRMEGMEGLMEQAFNALNKVNPQSDELVRKRRQAAPELTDEQKQYKQEPKKMRLDFFFRRNGMEQMHNNFDESILAVVPQFMKTLDLANVVGLAQEKLSSISYDDVAQSAGTLTDATISVPTIAGFPILVKNELYFLSNVGLKQNFEVTSIFNLKMGFEIQPTAAVHMARTVTVDTGFDRAGLKSQTSALTSTGVKTSLEGNLNGAEDILFSFKMDPIKKLQTILELKTDILFVQHSGASNVIATPVLSSSELAPVTSKCFTPASVKLFGRRLCLDTNFPWTSRPQEYVQQNPGSFRLFIDKDDSFGVYEATLKFKREENSINFLAVLGDQKSKDRHAKIEFSLVNTADSRKITLDLSNPVLPVRWESESKKKGEGFDLGVELKFGSTDYAFKGSKNKDANGDWKLEGDFYRKDKDRQRIKLVTTYGFYGFLRYLPLFRFDLSATTPNNDKLTFNHLVKLAAGKFEVALRASHEKSGSVLTSINSRLQFIRRDTAGQTRALLYDTEVVNKNGKNFMHSFSASVDRKPKAGVADTWTSTANVIHKFQHGVSKENTIIDIDMNLQLEETIKPGLLYKSSGSGSLKVEGKTVKLSDLSLVLGEADELDGHFSTKSFRFGYTADLDDTQVRSLIALQVLPIQNWNLYNQCVFITLEASKKVGSDKKEHLFELRHTSVPSRSGLPVFEQTAQLVYANEVLLNASHRLFPISSVGNEYVAGHTWSVKVYDGKTYASDTQYIVSVSEKFVIKVNTALTADKEKRVQLNQTLTVDTAAQKFDYKIDCQRLNSFGSFRVYSKYYEYSERRQAMKQIGDYLRNARTEDFRFTKFWGLVRKNFAKIEGGFDLIWPSYKLQVTNFFDLSVNNGVFVNFTRTLKTEDGTVWKRAVSVYKELEMTPARYRRLYRVNADINGVVSKYEFETIFLRSANPELKISVSKASISGEQSPDFTLNVGGQFIPRVSRNGQVGLNLNLVHSCKTGVIEAKYKLVVDTAPWSVLNPAFNSSLAVTFSSQGLAVQSFNGVYSLVCLKSKISDKPTLRNMLTFNSELTLDSTFPAIPFTSYKGVTTVSSSNDELFNFVFKKSLDDNDLINLKANLNSEQLYIGAKSDVLPVKEVSYKVEYKRQSDGFTNYVSKLKLKTTSEDYSVTDTGKLKASGRSGNQLFSFEYLGNLKVEGLDNFWLGTGRFDYSGLLAVQTTGEFDTNFKLARVKDDVSKNLGLVSLKLNYWPFEISTQLDTQVLNIGRYALSILAGPQPDRGFKFKAWLASQEKETAYQYSHTYKKTENHEVNAQATFTSDHLFSQKSDKIDTTLTVNAASFFDFSFLLKTTTPFKTLQLIQYNAVSRELRQTAVLTVKINDVQGDLLSVDHVKTKGATVNTEKVNIAIAPIGRPFYGFRKITYVGDLVTGGDYAWGFEVTKDDAKLASFDILWLKSGGKYPHLSRLSTPSANVGFDLNGQSNFHFHLLRSGTEAKSLWELQYKGYADVEAKVELTNGRITSGFGKAGGKTIQFTSPSEGVIEIKADSGRNTITYRSAPQSLNLKFTIGGKESCTSYKKESEKIVASYGSCGSPNIFKINYQISDFWNKRKAKVQIAVEHTTVPASNQAFNLLPGLSIPLAHLSGFPFKFTLDMDNQKFQGKSTFESSAVSLKGSQEYDLSKFPGALKFKRITIIDVGPVRSEQKWQIDYDISARTVDIKIEIDRSFKLAATSREISIDIAGVFIGGVAYKTEASTKKDTVQIKWELSPAPGSQPCVLSLWKGENDAGGRRLGLEFVEHTGKELKIFTDVLKAEFTTAGYNLKVVTTLSSTLFERLRSATSSVDASLKREAGAYTLNYKESFTAGGVLYYDIDVSLAGTSMRFPSTVSSILKGFTESEFKYNFNPKYNPESYLGWSLGKYGETRDAYKFEFRKKPSSNHVGQILGDFSLEFSSPKRQFYLSESCKVFSNGTVQTEVQTYLNKRNLEGFLAVFNTDFTQANVYKRSLQLTLPTRQVGYERVLKLEGKKLSFSLVAFWDMQVSLDKKISLQFEREKESRPAGYYYYHRLDLTAPFLRQKVTKEVLYEQKEDDFTLAWIHTQESYDKVTMKITGKKYWSEGRGAYQKELNLSFAQQRGDVKADTRITVETARLLNQKLPQVYTSAKFIHVINVYTVIPSQSVDSHVRLRIVPSEEFTYACNHGATFSFRYYKGFKRSRLFVFVSNSKKEAGQLTVVRDWLLSTWQATLDSGTGYMDPKSTLSFPIYEPKNVLVKATAGLSGNRKKIHFGVVNGAMSISTNVNLWKPDTVPADLDFLFVGAKLNDDNTLGYASHWRIRQATVKSPFQYVKEILVDPWTKVKNLPLGASTVNKVLKPVFQSKSDNINTDVVLDILTSISSNDIDSLKRWTDKARENNDFLSNTIGRYITFGFNLVTSGVQGWVAAVQALPYADVLPSDLGILAGIGKLSDAAERVLSSIPVGNIWGTTLSWIKYGSDLFSRYFSAYVDRVGSNIREKISALTGGSSTSILDMVYSATTSVYPIERAIEKLTTIITVSFESIMTADEELATQISRALQPFVFSSLGEVSKVYDFLDNVIYEFNQWSAYISGLIRATIRDNSQALDRAKQDLTQSPIPGMSTAYAKNLLTSLGLFLVGDYSGAIRQYFNTEANVVRVWRVSCDQACLNSGSFAAINGTIYLPFDTSAARAILPEDGGQVMYPSEALAYRQRLSRRSKLSLEALRSEEGFGGIVRKLISPEHRTAEATGTSIRTFDGKKLTNLAPCRYLLANDFLNGDFSIYQTYTWDGRQRARGDLLVRFFKIKATISNRNELKLNDQATALPASKTFEEQSVEAIQSGGAITVTFNSELQSAVVVKCRTDRNSCSLRVHPLYHGRLNGAFGSNDGNAENDLHTKSASEHMRVWVADSCVQS